MVPVLPAVGNHCRKEGPSNEDENVREYLDAEMDAIDFRRTMEREHALVQFLADIEFEQVRFSTYCAIVKEDLKMAFARGKRKVNTYL